MRPDWNSPNALYYRLNRIKNREKGDRVNSEFFATRKMLWKIIEEETGLSLGRVSMIWRGVHDDDITILISLGILEPKKEYLNPRHAKELEKRLATDEDARRIFMRKFCPSTSNFMRDDIGARVLEAAAEVGSYNILSAACGNGAETYTIAIALAEAKKRARIVGIDINPHAIETAREGMYSRYDPGIDLMPERIRNKYFEQVKSQWGYPELRVKKRIRVKANFYVANLMHPLTEQGLEGTFDVVCLRNAMKYMTEEGRKRALTSARQVLQKQGIFIIGNKGTEGEDVLGETEQFGFSKSKLYTPECPMYVRA
ncbi:methyltransferase domain-containing protein [Candidatus Woesearchaeota archaeon]|nr:methyltransferase domain-containing protein [Candidatus Woesearchaeota archaeon]